MKIHRTELHDGERMMNVWTPADNLKLAFWVTLASVFIIGFAVGFATGGWVLMAK
jgi:hypothetical protein